ncbi:MAG: tetratricopeptide repeat protein [Deltaproteobacteria bacterium]|nr:tetratricopeptide repeat protein [Deltaproteobacteria bacterium]
MRIDKLFTLLLATILVAGLAGCGSAPVLPMPEAAPVVPERSENSDQARLKDALRGREMPPGEAVDLSDRMLNDNNSLNDQGTMAGLELILLRALKSPDKTHKPAVWRNLGIIHYSQKKFKLARQELQSAIESNPKDARTRYYLARVFSYQGEIYEKQGKKKLARQQFKRAAIEMELARKIEPNNALYRQNIKQMTGRE